MSQPSIPPAESAPKRWQFSIRGMLLFTASVALGLSAMTIDTSCWFGSGEHNHKQDNFVGCIVANWPAGLLAMIFFWIGLGLISQIRDLRRCLASHRDLGQEQRFGGKCEIAWRIAVLAIFALYVANATLLDQRFYSLRDATGVLREPGPMIREGIFAILTLVLVGTVPFIRRERQLSHRRMFVGMIAWAAAIGLCLLLWMNATSLVHLVHLATFGIDHGFPNSYSAIDAKRYPTVSTSFFWRSVEAGLIVVANGAFLNRLAKDWPKGVGRRLAWLACLFAGTAFVGAYSLSAATHGLRELSPYAAQIGNPSTCHDWLAGIALVLLVATVLSYRLSCNRNLQPGDCRISWRARCDGYSNERRMTLLILVAVLFMVYFRDLYRTLVLFGVFRGGISRLYDSPMIGELAVLMLFDPVTLLWLAVVLAALRRAFRRRSDHTSGQAELPHVDRAKFVTVWLAAVAFTISGASASAWMSFGLWFCPWLNHR